MTAKHAMFFALFTQGRVSVTLDARCPGVLLPEPLLRYPILVLDYGMALSNPTADIHLEETGIRRCSICPRGYDVVMPIVRVSHPDAPPEKGKKPWFGFCARCIDVLATQGRKALEGR